MKKNPGMLVSYTTKDGSTQKAIMRHADQLPAVTDTGRALLILLNDNLTEKQQDGKPLRVVKKTELLTTIGYVD